VRHAKIEWRRLGLPLRQALQAEPSIGEVYDARHEKCRGKSMGEHYAGESPQHGLPTEPEHHLGDLGNIEIGQNGEGNLVIVVPGANLDSGSERSFVGRAIVVHESRDLGTGPSGESGAPIACAVIKAED